MRISEILARRHPVFSFEFFPPKDAAAAQALLEVIHNLKELHPDFVSVTYGAGGSTRTKTLELVARIKLETGLEPMAHLTCVGHSRREIRSILDDLAARGIENILALRGDPPRGDTRFRPRPDGFRYANELAEEVAKSGRFCFGVAGYPEKHIEAPSLEEDLRNLKRKVDTGASFVITQLFFQNDCYFDFVARARAIGIRCPVIPGIMPVTNFAQIQRFATLCGASLPSTLVAELEPVQSDPEAVTRVGIRFAAAQCRELLHRGAPGIHFYTLNKSRATREILVHLKSLHLTTRPLLRDV
jgi:methylenetetrahydrofolate reductase (NADPH)